MASPLSNVSSLLWGAIAVSFFFLCPVTWSQPSNDHAWESFRKLSGCDIGEYRPGIADLKRYLNQFGYLPGGNFTDEFNPELESAIISYQNFFNLNITGRLDASTVDLITTPRCGVPDVMNSTVTSSSFMYASQHRRSLYNYFPGRPVWPRYKRHLLYAFLSPANGRVRAIFARAFARWSNAIPLSFSETDGTLGYADITITFGWMDGPGNKLAYAYAPTDGRMIVDSYENWWFQAGALSQSALYDLESVVVHEIGHLLGLDHSTVPQAIMFPTIPPRTRKVQLSYDDLQGIWGLYGRRF